MTTVPSRQYLGCMKMTYITYCSRQRTSDILP